MAKPDLKTISKIEIKIRLYQVAMLSLLSLSVLSPVLAWHEVWQQDENAGAWFQRSGCLTVLFSALAEYIIFIIRDLLDPIGDEGYSYQDNADGGYLKANYRKMLNFSSFISIALLVMGTLIWGFGDLIR